MPPVSLAVGALWLCGPPWEALVVLCVLHHRRISETGKEVAGIHGFFLGEEASTWDPMLKPEADSSQAGQPPPLRAPAPSAPGALLVYVTCRTTYCSYQTSRLSFIISQPGPE